MKTTRTLLAGVLAAALALTACSSEEWEKACTDKGGRIERDRETRARVGTKTRSGGTESRKVLYCVDKDDGHEITEPYKGVWS